MATEDERVKILSMIQEGKITPEQGVQLLDTLDEGERRSRGTRPGFAPTPPPAYGGKSRRWFRVMVTDTGSGRVKVNVRLPVGLVSAGMKMGARFAPQIEGLNAGELMQHLNSGEVGQIVDVLNDAEGEHVEVFIE